jgi:hypothetical protein
VISVLRNSSAAFVVLLALAIPSLAPASTGLTCNVCNLRLTSRTGPYKIIAAKEAAGSPSAAPHIRVRIINDSSRPIVVGGSAPRTEVRLNFVTPGSRGTEVLRVGGSGRPRNLPPKAFVSFEATYGYRLGRPGLYQFNVSYNGVDSNIVTYAVR